jgi:hypothetical protein
VSSPLTAFDESLPALFAAGGCVLSVVSTTEAISAARAADGTISATNVHHERLALYGEKQKIISVDKSKNGHTVIWYTVNGLSPGETQTAVR